LNIDVRHLEDQEETDRYLMEERTEQHFFLNMISADHYVRMTPLLNFAFWRTSATRRYVAGRPGITERPTSPLAGPSITTWLIHLIHSLVHHVFQLRRFKDS
jgi:hypothetical protein